MIPVPKGMYEKVLFKNLEESYKVLINKEFKFCLKNRDKIQKKCRKNLYETKGKKYNWICYMQFFKVGTGYVKME